MAPNFHIFTDEDLERQVYLEGDALAKEVMARWLADAIDRDAYDREVETLVWAKGHLDQCITDLQQQVDDLRDERDELNAKTTELEEQVSRLEVGNIDLAEQVLRMAKRVRGGE